MENSQLKITALSVADLIKVLKHAGSRTVSEENIRKDIADGHPVNPDGTINLITYTAWLIKEMSNAD